VIGGGGGDAADAGLTVSVDSGPSQIKVNPCGQTVHVLSLAMNTQSIALHSHRDGQGLAVTDLACKLWTPTCRTSINAGDRTLLTEKNPGAFWHRGLGGSIHDSSICV
jgi:hypothetical protein